MKSLKILLGASIFSLFVFLLACHYERSENFLTTTENETNVEAPLFSQVYSCLQTLNGEYTGQSYEMTLDFFPNRVVSVSRTLRPSTEGDEINVINLSSNPIIQTTEGAKISNSSDTWIIPFRDEPAFRVSGGTGTGTGGGSSGGDGGETKVKCSCEGTGKCSLMVRPNKATCESDLDPACDSCCKMTLIYSTANGNSQLLGGAVILNANVIQHE